jgi:hypothetical protein
MPTPDAITADEHINVIRGAAPTYMKGFADLTHRGHVLLALMKQHGMIEFNANDFSRIWQVQAYEPEVRVGSDTTRQTFQNHNPYKQCQIDVRDYVASDLLTEGQYKKNRGRNQLINLYDQKMKNLGKSMVRRLQEWMYRDGDAAAYDGGFNGFESCLADDAGTLVTEKVAAPSDTYAGLSTALGALGGSWTTDLAAADRYNAGLANDFPYGQGDTEYDYFSPLLINWGSSAFTTAGSWEDNCDEVLRFGSSVMRGRNGYMNAEGLPLINLLAPNLYEAAENHYATRFRTVHPYTMGDLGFPQKTLHLDGTVLQSDYSVPTDVGYGICPAHMEAFFLETINGGGEDSMVDTFGPTWDDTYAAFLMRVTVFGNMRMTPKFMIKYSNYADT